MKIRQALKSDIPKILKIHFNTYDKKETSILLGPRVATHFYECSIKDASTHCLVLEHENEVIGFSVAFQDLAHFEKLFRAEAKITVLFCLLKKVISLQWISFFTLLKRILFSTPPIQGEVYNQHLGNLSLDLPFRNSPLAIIQFGKLFNQQIDFLLSKNKGLWTSALSHNKDSILWIKRAIKPDQIFEKTLADQNFTYFLKK